METLFDLWSLPFMKKALFAGLLSGAIGSYYGAFVVQRRLSFLGNGLAHSALGGVALGLLLGQNPMMYAIIFTIIIALLMTWLRQKTSLSSDTAIGIFFSLSVATGMILLSLNENYTVDAFSYLFGSILSINETDLWILIFFFVANLFILPSWGRWTYATFDRELARTDLIKVERDDYLINALIATTVVVAMKIMGIILLTAFLIVPAASARLISNRFAKMSLYAVLIGMFSTITGLILSYYWDFPSGAVIVLCQGALFFMLLPFSKSN